VGGSGLSPQEERILRQALFKGGMAVGSGSIAARSSRGGEWTELTVAG
jgi:hypothetical protein